MICCRVFESVVRLLYVSVCYGFVNKFSASISTGNCYGLQRSHSEVKESVEIVAGNATSPYVYDSFAFVATDMMEYFSTGELDFSDDILVGTSTTSCFTFGSSIVGGMIVSLPWDDGWDSEKEDFFDEYKNKFGDELVETFNSRPKFSADGFDSYSASEIGLTNDSMTVFEEDEISVDQGFVSTFGFVSNNTFNILYLVTGSESTTEQAESVVRHLDTLTVFESPKNKMGVTGTVWVPCSRMISSPKFQSYLESEYELSNGSHLNLGSLDSPHIYVDSSLEFTYSEDLQGEYQVEVVGSRNSNQIELQVKDTLTDVSTVDSSELTTIKTGCIGKQPNGGEVFIGQTYVDWSCGCDSSVCPTVVIISSSNEISSSILSEIDSILNESEGREAFEIDIGNVTLDNF